MDEKNYEINIEQIKIDFKFKENGGLTNTQGNKYFYFLLLQMKKIYLQTFPEFLGNFLE